jgi:hypothetical protein
MQTSLFECGSRAALTEREAYELAKAAVKMKSEIGAY